MLGESKKRSMLASLKKLPAIGFTLMLILSVAQSQVVIVPSKLRSTRPTTRTKSKSKSKPAVTTTAINNEINDSPSNNRINDENNPVNAEREKERISDPPSTPQLKEKVSDPLSTQQSLAFVVVPPKLQASLTGGTALTAKVSSSPIPLLLSYDFTVINADDHGRVTERRDENARYFNEDLPGGINLEMVEIPGGTFMMGSVQTDVELFKKNYVHNIDKEIRASLLRRLNWEMPQHLTNLSGFYMSKFEITQAQWRAVASLPKVNRDLMSDPSYFKGGNRPVEKISWEDAVEFCERLSRATGRKFRLPTETEWEYACRAGTNSAYHFGDSVKAEWANYNGRQNFGFSPRGNYREQTVPVGSLNEANAFGLYDMHGNVWEWCLDSWHDSYQYAPEDGRPWDNSGILYLKILRGGAWDSSAGECRSGSRNKMTSTIHLNNIGFRVIVESAGQLANK